MRIPPVDVTQVVKPLVSIKEIAAPDVQSQIGGVGGDLSASFTQAMKKAVGEVNSLQTQADKLAQEIAELTGEKPTRIR